MKMVKKEAKIPMDDEASEMLKKEYQWMLLKDARYGWRGDTIIKMANKNEVLNLYRAVEGKAITVAGGGRIVLEVLPHISLLAEARARVAPF